LPPVATRNMDRRRFLSLTTAAAAAWPFANMSQSIAADRRVRMKDNPFSLGVASGDPLPDGVVLWTRLCPEPLTPNGGMPPEDVQVNWQVSTNEAMTQIVRKGMVTAPADWAHSVHVEVDGLESDRVYWYQFKHGTETSPVGRTRTAPREDVLLDQFRFAFASCQHYEDGYFNAYQKMSQEDLRLVIHLGDYIYEGASRKKNKTRPREHAGPRLAELQDFRIRHAQYKLDPHLQATHAAFPWLVTWDDHETENNYAGFIPQKGKTSIEAFPQLRANAYKAYYEHMPLRRTAVPQGPNMQLYRNVVFGQLVQFSVLDTRQYRSDQPCNDGIHSPCEEVFNPRSTMLGETQEAWLQQKLVSSSSQWNVLAQQVPIARINYHRPESTEELLISMDKWAGCDAARRRLMKFFDESRITNPVVLTGDVHSNWVNDLRLDYDDVNAPTIGTEFVGTSISSAGDGPRIPKDSAHVLSRNPAVKFYNRERGYVRCEVTPQQWRSDYQVVEIVSQPNQPCVTRASYVVENGRPGAVEG